MELFKREEPAYFKEYFDEGDTPTLVATICLAVICYSLFAALAPLMGSLPVFLAH